MPSGPEPAADDDERPLPTGRHAARERALHLLYEAECKGAPPHEVAEGLPVSPDEFTSALVDGVTLHGAELDAVIAEHARGWRLDRMPALDRAVLRLGAFELLYQPDVPTAVVIDEAVELAKQYSTDDSGRYVNGVLAALAATVRGPQ